VTRFFLALITLMAFTGAQVNELKSGAELKIQPLAKPATSEIRQCGQYFNYVKSETSSLGIVTFIYQKKSGSLGSWAGGEDKIVTVKGTTLVPKVTIVSPDRSTIPWIKIAMNEAGFIQAPCLKNPFTRK
jgi:hypothetical protein